METVGVVGAGVMGLTAARTLSEGGHALAVFDPSPKARDAARSLGAGLAATPGEVAEAAEVVLMFLPGPEQVTSCVAGSDGLLSASQPGMILVDMSTVDPATTRSMAALATERGVGYLDAPVLGRPVSVGKWALPVGGRKEHLDRCRPVLRLLAANIMHVGESGSGNKIKLLNQLMFGAINAMTAEMMAVSERLGVPAKSLYDTITASQAGTVSNLFIELGRKIISEDYEDPTFSVDLLCKDVRLAIDMAREAGAPPLLARTVQFLNEVAQSQGLGGKDTSMMWKIYGPMWGP